MGIVIHYRALVIVIIAVCFLSFLSCTKSEPPEKDMSRVSHEAVASIIEQLTPQQVDYEGNHTIFAITPARDKIYIVKTSKDMVMENLKAKALEGGRWKIQLGEDQHVVDVQLVDSAKVFSSFYPFPVEGLLLGVGATPLKGKCCPPNQYERNRDTPLENVPCEKVGDSYVRNHYSHSGADCIDSEDANQICHVLNVHVGTQYFYGDDPDCTESIGNAPIWKNQCQRYPDGLCAGQ